MIQADKSPNGGMTYTNASGAELHVTIKEGPETPEARLEGELRTTTFLLKPGQSRSVLHATTESRVTWSSDTSKARGVVKFIPGHV